MKRSLKAMMAALLMGLFTFTFAQTDPGVANLKHQWTFDDGTAIDQVGQVEGTIIGNATLVNKGFNTSNGGSMSFPASQIGLNNYPELSIEIWCTSAQGKNTGWTMLSFFGDTDASGWGRNYTFISIARAVDGSMASLETTAWDGVEGPEYDDGRLHHFMETIDAQTLKYYIDGTLIATDTLTAGNQISNISTNHAYLGRGGWTADPDWLGVFHKYSLYNKALTADEILYLYQAGAEEQAVISTTQSEIALDTYYPAETFNVTSSNLTSDISITVPEGIIVYPQTIPMNEADVELSVIWDGSKAVDGNIVLSSSGLEVSIPVKTADDSECYSPWYPDDVNFVTDPGINNLSNFAGWGLRELQTVISHPENVYCGASSVKIGTGTEANSGSLNVPLDGLIEPNTTYVTRAMIKTVDGSFQLGVYGWSAGEGDLNSVIDTNGEWQQVELKFTTGAILGDFHGMFINNWTCTGTVAFADNWEMYQSSDASLSFSIPSLAFDPEYKSAVLTLAGGNLTEDAALTAPAGLTLSVSSISPDGEGKINGDTILVDWDGTTEISDSLQVSSSGLTLKIAVKTTNTSNENCFIALFTDKLNLITDPYVNKLSSFGGWGTRKMVSIADAPDSVYCGSHSAMIENSGSLDWVTTGVLKKNTIYISRAMIRTLGGSFQIGAFGYDALATGDMQDTLDTQGEWMPISLEFATSDTLGATSGIFINNYQRTGQNCYIDNWELYEMGPTAVLRPEENSVMVYAGNGRITAEFEAENASAVNMKVYDVRGVLISSRQIYVSAGKNFIQTDKKMNPGVYLIKLNVNDETLISKIVL